MARGDRSGREVSDPDDAIGHMVRNYSGVGKRTAERLVAEFGSGVFEVIDDQPDRISRLLSKRQADAVIAARETEQESGEAS